MALFLFVPRVADETQTKNHLPVVTEVELTVVAKVAELSRVSYSLQRTHVGPFDIAPTFLHLFNRG